MAKSLEQFQWYTMMHIDDKIESFNQTNHMT